jgi:hypothetical protein
MWCFTALCELLATWLALGFLEGRSEAAPTPQPHTCSLHVNPNPHKFSSRWPQKVLQALG